MIKIIFTKEAAPVSDFNAEEVVEVMLNEIKDHVWNQRNLDVKVCNMLIHTMLRAAYNTTYKHLQEYTTWWYEDTQIEVSEKMEIEDDNFWSQPCTDLEGEAFKNLFGM